MDREQLRNDLEYITLGRALPEGESLRAVLGRLDLVAEQQGNDRRLEHYLTKRSYAKALAWLDNPDMSHHR